MKRHLQANVWMLLLTLIVCAVLYPGVVWLIGRTVFANRSQGSLVGKDGAPVSDEKNAVGSRLIAQPFLDESGNVLEEYFQPRPSAASYNGAASGATNWGADSPDLRKRVIGMLGPLLKYEGGRPVGPDIVAWVRGNLRNNRAVLAEWAAADESLAERWSAFKVNDEFLAQWRKDHADDVSGWRRANSKADEPKPADLTLLFFDSYARGATTSWPDTDGRDIQAAFFEVWRRAHPEARFTPVPADMVMASGSGLDPHITSKNALYQLDRVADAWAKKTTVPRERAVQAIRELLEEKKEAPLGGLAGVELVNVLELNLALPGRMQRLAPAR